jgi:hypothetical protein
MQAESIQLDKNALVSAWRRQIGRRRFRPSRQIPRDLVAMGFLHDRPAHHGLIEVKQLLLVALYDEGQGPQRAIWLAGVVGRLAEWGVHFNAERVLRNLAWLPTCQMGMRRQPAIRAPLLDLGLRLDQFVELHTRFRDVSLPTQPVLPPLWAALRQADATPGHLDGPELEGACQRTGKAAGELFDTTLRRFRGLYLLPLEWVAGHWKRFVEVYADIKAFPRLQVFAPTAIPEGLTGYHGAASFDFRMPVLRRWLQHCSHSGHSHADRTKSYAPVVAKS